MLVVVVVMRIVERPVVKSVGLATRAGRADELRQLESDSGAASGWLVR